MEQGPLDITNPEDITKDVRQMFIDVLGQGTLIKSWRVDPLKLPPDTLERMAYSLSDVALRRHLSLKWSTTDHAIGLYKVITATLLVEDETKARLAAMHDVIAAHFADFTEHGDVTVENEAFKVSGEIPYKDHKMLDEYVRKLKADMRKRGIDLDYEYTNQLGDTPVPFALEIKVKPADTVEYKQLESDSATDLVDMVEWAMGVDASSIQGAAEEDAKSSYAENGCLVLSTGKSNVLVSVGEWAVKINGKLTGVISDEFKKHVCGE